MKTHLIPDLLDALVATPAIERAAAQVGLTARTVHRYLVRSRAGDAVLQSIEWMGIAAPLHIHYSNAMKLAASAIEATALDRARNGCWVPSYFRGAPVFEENEDFIGWTDEEMVRLGWDPKRDRFVWETGPDGKLRRKIVHVWLKPSEQLTIKMLESHFAKKYGAHQTIDVNYASTLTLTRPEERQPKMIEHKPEKQLVFDDETAAPERRGQNIAAGRPARNSEEFDKWAAQNEFAHTAVEVQQSDGSFKPISAAPSSSSNAGAMKRPTSPGNLGAGPDRPSDPETCAPSNGPKLKSSGIDHTRDATHTRYDDVNHVRTGPHNTVISSEGYGVRRAGPRR